MFLKSFAVSIIIGGIVLNSNSTLANNELMSKVQKKVEKLNSKGELAAFFTPHFQFISKEIPESGLDELVEIYEMRISDFKKGELKLESCEQTENVVRVKFKAADYGSSFPWFYDGKDFFIEDPKKLEAAADALRKSKKVYVFTFILSGHGKGRITWSGHPHPIFLTARGASMNGKDFETKPDALTSEAMVTGILYGALPGANEIEISAESLGKDVKIGYEVREINKTDKIDGVAGKVIAASKGIAPDEQSPPMSDLKGKFNYKINWLAQ